MKKFKKILVAFVSVLTVFVLASCQETKKPTVEFLTHSIELGHGEERNLEDESILKIENTKIKDVLFVSSDNTVVIVSPDNKIKTVGTGTAQIMAKVGESESSIVVNVSVSEQPFAKVSEIVYNPNTAEVSWNPPFVLVDGKEIVANGYKLDIKRSGTTYNNYEKISNTRYKFLQGGDYTIGVSAIASNYAYSEEVFIKFTVLDTPTGLEFQKGESNTHTIKWDTQPNATLYELKVNDESYFTNENSYSLKLENPNTYLISVKAIKSENEHSVFTEPLEIVKLQKPVLKLENGVLKVALTKQEPLDYFALTVKAYLDEGNFTTFNSTTGEFDLSSLTAGNYVTSVITVAKNTGFVISSEKSDTLNFEKLDTPTISFDTLTNQVFVSGAEEGVKLFAEDTLTNSIEELPLVDGKHDFNKPYGEFRLWAQNLATESNVINSTVSSDLVVKVIAYTKDVQHSITMIANEERSVVSFQKVLGATNYEIKVDGVTYPATVLKEIDSRISFVLQGRPDEIFGEAREYEIEVIAVDSEYSNILIYGQEANNKIVITRLDAVEEINFSNPAVDEPIVWQASNGAIGYTYVLERYSQFFKEGILESASFEVKSLDFGSYKLQIYTTGNQKEFLSSLNYAEIEFVKHKKLHVPALSFDRENKMLLIEQVENANEYRVFYEDEIIETLVNELSLNISEFLTEEKEHNFYVIAVNSSDGNLIPSEKSYLNIVKLESVKEVVYENESVFKYDDGLLLSAQNSTGYTLQVKIDGEIVDIGKADLTMKDNFALSVIKIANTTSTNPYFISSEEFVLNFKRLETVQNLSFVNWLLEWDNVESADEYEIVFESGSFKQTLIVEQNSLDLNEQEFKNQLENGFSFFVKAVKNQGYFETGATATLSSFLSEEQVVGVLLVPQIESVEKIEENIYKVVWAEVENAEYMTEFEGVVESAILNEKEFVLNQNQKTHTLKLKAVSPNHISSEENVFVFERLAQVEKVMVFENSTFEIIYNMPAHLKEQVLVLVNNESVLLENKIDITTVGLSQKNQYKFAIWIDAEFIFENAYYISSKVSDFVFEKHLSIENLRVEEGSIKWQENPSHNYELVFKNSQEETLSLIIPARDLEGNYVNSFSLADSRIKEFVEKSSISYVVAIKVKINDYELEKGVVGKIDGELTEDLQLLKLEQVQSLSVGVADNQYPQQKVLAISWDAVQDASFYNVYVNNNLLFENQTATRVESDFFVFENSIKENNKLTGRFEVIVIAFAENMIESEPSQVLSFTRLDKVDGFKTTNNKGGLQWDANIFSEDFVFYMENQTNETSEIVEISNAVTYSFENMLKEEMFKEGTFSLYILVSGNKAETFSSAYEKLDVVRLDAPNFAINGNKIVVEESLIFENAKFELTVYFKETGEEELVEIEKFDLFAGDYILPTELKYKDGSEIVKDGIFVFEMIALDAGHITSVKTTKEKVKLNSVFIEGIQKVENSIMLNETSFELVLSIGNVAQTATDENPDLEVVISVTNNKDNNEYTYIDKTAKNRQGEIVYDIQEIFFAMKGNFSVKVKVSAVGYIDSKIVSISGVRLEQNQSLVAKAGVLTWTRSIASSSSGYMLKVDYAGENDGESTMIKKIENLAVVSDELKGISGPLTANVKVLSNMPMNTRINKNIVLDSFYMGKVEVFEEGDLTFEEEPYLATKLPALEEVQIKQGMFYFKKLGSEFSVSYALIPLDDYFNGAEVEYDLSIEFQDEEYIQALSNMFYQGQYKLSKDKEYLFSIKALAHSQNMLDSDAGQELKVKVLSTVNNINVEWKQYETGETNRFDTVAITWNPSTEILNPQYIYSLGTEAGNNEPLKIVESPEYIIRSNNALNAKNYNFRVRVVGSSQPTSEGLYYLTSEYSSSVTLTGLATPRAYLSNGVFTWDAVPFAEGYYIYYMKRLTNNIITSSEFSQNKTWVSEFITGTSWVVPESFSDSNDIQSYYIAVVAINRDVSKKYMPSAYGTRHEVVEGEDGTVLEGLGYFVVAKSPDLFQNNNGVLMWHGLDYVIANFNPLELEQGIKPFVYGASVWSVLETLITVKIGDDPNKQILLKNFEAASLFYANIFNNPMFKMIAPQYGFNLDMEFGIGHIDQFINEAFPEIKAGSNFISAMQIGNDLNLISSKYNAGKEFYIPQQVNTKITNSILSWNDIVLPSDRPYNNSTGKYIVISEDDEGKRFEVTRTNDFSVNLLEFINNDTLKPGNHKLYVIVAGDGEYYLNGIAAPYISTFILPPINARLDKGILIWDSMQNTSGFLLRAITDGQEDSRTIEKPMNVNVWGFEELKATNSLGESIEYDLSVQALGNGTTIISGKETKFGVIIKLSTPSVDIVKGVFEWNNIENNVGYMIDIVGDDNILFSIGTDITQYESVYTGFNTYNFRAVGSTTANLQEGTSNYAASSFMSEGLNAVMLESVEKTNTNDGRIIWKGMTDYSGKSIEEYKMSFSQDNFKPSVFLNGSNDYTITSAIDGVRYIAYQLAEDYPAGVYRIYLQAHSEDTYVRNQKTYRYLLSAIDIEESSTQFEKLQAVENIRILDGVVLWDNPNQYDGLYHVTLVQDLQIHLFVTEENFIDFTKLSQAEMENYDKISANSPVNIKVQVIGNQTSIINSDETRISSITKLKTIAKEDIDYVSEEDGSTGFVIRWYLLEREVGVQDYHYIISYVDNPDSEEVKTLSSATSNFIVKGYDQERKLDYAEIDAAYLLDKDSSELSYKVAVVPISNSFFISSSFSEVRSFSPPESLSGEFVFDQESQKISWPYSRSGSDVIFKIVDELVEINAENEVVVIRTNEYLSQEREYYPKEIGLHRIKIAVILGIKGQVTSAYVYFYYEANLPGLINDPNFELTLITGQHNFTLLDFNLFESGEGSSEMPYQISSETHFKNIKHRSVKPKYFLGEENFTFVQTKDLNVEGLTTGIQNFAGIYNGQEFALTYHITSSKNTSLQDIALFETVTSAGHIKNLVINSIITINQSQNVSEIKMSALARTNNGIIENVLIKSFNVASHINKNIRYIYGAVAVQNNGTIKNTISRANITFKNGQGHSNISSSEVIIGGLVENNTGQIVDSGSYANFDIIARRVTVAGIAVASQESASLMRVFNKGNIKVLMQADSTSPSYIAGLVGRNLGLIYSSYSSASEIEVNLAGTSHDAVYIGGLVGLIQGVNGSLISNSFTLTPKITLTNKGTTTDYLGVMVGRSSGTQDNPAQIKSYYQQIGTTPVINGDAITTFKTEKIEDRSSLFNSLNAVDAGVFKLISGVISHIWEDDFSLS